MTIVGKFAVIPEFRSSEQITTNDDAAVSEEEVEQQIAEDNVEKAAHKSRIRVSTPLMSNKQIEIADDAVASKEEVEEQVEESRIDKVAFEGGMSTASAKEYIQSGRTHG
jgi:hypothetical protein